MRVVFMGTPDFAVPTLTEILGQGHEIVAVYTQPPRKAGRGMELRRSPVHERADAFAIPVKTPVSFRDPQEIDDFESLNADIAVVVAYGLLLPKSVLDAPQYGCLNLHASLLPRWRGAAPINRAVLAGDKQSGVVVIKMEEGLDTGPVGMAETLAIDPDMTAGDLHDKLMVLGGDLMARALGAVERQSLSFQEQEKTGVTYAKKLSKGETRIDWSKAGLDVHNHIRGLSPFPGAWAEFETAGTRHRLKVLRSTFHPHKNGAPGEILDDMLLIACGTGAVRLEQVQRSGKAVMSGRDFLLGNPLHTGDKME